MTEDEERTSFSRPPFVIRIIPSFIQSDSEISDKDISKETSQIV